MLAINEIYQGIYQISETVNGQPSWKKDNTAIWYTEVNTWDIGPVQYIGSLMSRMYTIPISGGLTDELNDWKYYDGQGNLLRSTAKRKLERLQFSTSSSFVKIWSPCSWEFKAYFLTFWALHRLLFDLETIGVN